MVYGHRENVIFFFNDTATTEIYTLSLHDALPISGHADITDSVFDVLGVENSVASRMSYGGTVQIGRAHV